MLPISCPLPLVIFLALFSFFSTSLAQSFDLYNSEYYSRDIANATSKAGLAWPNRNTVDIREYDSKKVSWYYTWSIWPYPSKTTLEFIPMLWGQRNADQFASMIQKTISQEKIQVVLGMNEPEQKGQSDMTPEDGATLWKSHLEPLRSQGIRLGSPAPAGAPSGKSWLQNFFTACDGGCVVDFLALHWYGTNSTQFISYVQEYHATFNLSIWVTEWACQNFANVTAQCSQDDVIRFMNETQTFMDHTEWVERYAWFGAMRDMSGVNEDNRLMDLGGNINDLGRQYIGGNGTILSNAGYSLSRTPHIAITVIGTAVAFIVVHIL